MRARLLGGRNSFGFFENNDTQHKSNGEKNGPTKTGCQKGIGGIAGTTKSAGTVVYPGIKLPAEIEPGKNGAAEQNNELGGEKFFHVFNLVNY